MMCESVSSALKQPRSHYGTPMVLTIKYHLQAFSGRDASQAFISYHRRNFPHARVKTAFVAVDKTVHYTSEDHSDFMEICDRVNKVLPRLMSFAPWHYYMKVAFLICSLVFMEMYCHYNRYYSFPISIVIGLHVAITGEVKDEWKSLRKMVNSLCKQD